MQDTKISWSQKTWNAVSGCSKVSDGCRFCYAMTLSLERGWTTKPWTVQNEMENIVIKPHKLHEPYTVREPTRIFVNSMSDMFHRVIPDWYRAAMFAVMLDNPQHIFQILTKRAEATVDWHKRYVAAVQSQDFRRFADRVTRRDVKSALVKAAALTWKTPWADHIWQGVSVEDARVLHRIDCLRQCRAQVRFISAEPLLGPWGDVDLTGIHWVIVGGESGRHMGAQAQREENPRWMDMEWACEIRDLCANQGVAYFFKQDSGFATEMRPYLIHRDGTRWEWKQYPGQLVPPRNIDTGQSMPYGALPDTDWGESEPFIAWAQTAPATASAQAQPAARVVHFDQVREHWDTETQTWDSPEYVYIGRANAAYRLPASPWANPYRVWDESQRASVMAQYRRHLTVSAAGQALVESELETLRGKTLVCWCRPKACHGDVLLELLGQQPEVALEPDAAEEKLQQTQLALF